MDNFLAKFSSLGEDIQRQLNVKSLSSFRGVSKTWKDFTDTHKPIYEKMFLKHFRNNMSLKTRKKILVRIPTKTMKELAICVDDFFKNKKYETYSDWMGKHQWSLLHIIAECKNVHLYQYLINRLDEKNPKTNKGVTPLFIAASKGYFEVP